MLGSNSLVRFIIASQLLAAAAAVQTSVMESDTASVAVGAPPCVDHLVHASFTSTSVARTGGGSFTLPPAPSREGGAVGALPVLPTYEGSREALMLHCLHIFVVIACLCMFTGLRHR